VIDHPVSFGRDDGPVDYVFAASRAIIDADAHGIPAVAEGTPDLPIPSADGIAAQAEHDWAGRAWRNTDRLGRLTHTDGDGSLARSGQTAGRPAHQEDGRCSTAGRVAEPISHRRLADQNEALLIQATRQPAQDRSPSSRSTGND